LVVFFSRDGYRLGDKESLEELLCDITGIPALALRCGSLQHFSMAERISWGKSRITTEPEDQAYCLLGILDIRMATYYREGKEKAFQRLTEEMMGSNDSAPSIIPYHRNFNFVGRKSELAELEAKLFKANGTTKIAIAGGEGTGKSQLSLELAYVMKIRDRKCSISWVDTSSKLSLRQAYMRIAEKLRVSGWNLENPDPIQLVKHHLSNNGVSRWLLVFDDVEGPGLDPNESPDTLSADLNEHLPHSQQGSAVFTTTDGNIAPNLAPQNIVVLEGLTPSAARSMLCSYLGRSVPANEQQDLKSLLARLHHQPIAIRLAAACIKLTNISITEYQSRIVERGNLYRTLSRDDAKNAIPVSLIISLEIIDAKHGLAVAFVFFMACLNWKDIPLDLLKTRVSSNGDEAMTVLDDYGLIARRPADSAVDLLRPVQRAIRSFAQGTALVAGMA